MNTPCQDSGQPDKNSFVDAKPWWKALGGCVVAGALVLGLGSRLVMRVIALLAGPEYQGASTRGGNIVGQITVKGTIGMLVPGALGGLLAGGVYLLIRNWLPRNLVFRCLTFGGLAIVIFWGFLVGAKDNPDFRFTSLGVQLLLFVALLPIFGLFGAWLAERWGAGLPDPQPTWFGYTAIYGILLGGFIWIAATTLEMLNLPAG